MRWAETDVAGYYIPCWLLLASKINGALLSKTVITGIKCISIMSLYKVAKVPPSLFLTAFFPLQIFTERLYFFFATLTPSSDERGKGR